MRGRPESRGNDLYAVHRHSGLNEECRRIDQPEFGLPHFAGHRGPKHQSIGGDDSRSRKAESCFKLCRRASPGKYPMQLHLSGRGSLVGPAAEYCLEEVDRSAGGQRVMLEASLAHTLRMPSAPPTDQQISLSQSSSQAVKAFNHPAVSSNIEAHKRLPVRLLSLQAKSKNLSNSRQAKMPPLDKLDSILDSESRDLVPRVDVIANEVAPTDLVTVIGRAAAIRELNRVLTKPPQPLRIAPDEEQHWKDKLRQIEQPVAGRSETPSDISGDGATKALFPTSSDAASNQSVSSRPLQLVRRSFAEQFLAISPKERFFSGLYRRSTPKGARPDDKDDCQVSPHVARACPSGFYPAH